MSYCKNSKIKTNQYFNLGIVGNICNEAKGIYVLDYLAKEFNKENIPITIIGTKKEDIEQKIKILPNELFLGTYINANLQSIIESEKISIIAFTSICPETFSYVFSELTLLDIPIICFNIGAQAEKAKKYSKGIVVQNKEEMLNKLLELRNINILNSNNLEGCK